MTPLSHITHPRTHAPATTSCHVVITIIPIERLAGVVSTCQRVIQWRGQQLSLLLLDLMAWDLAPKPITRTYRPAGAWRRINSRCWSIMSSDALSSSIWDGPVAKISGSGGTRCRARERERAPAAIPAKQQLRYGKSDRSVTSCSSSVCSTTIFPGEGPVTIDCRSAFILLSHASSSAARSASYRIHGH